MSQQATVELLDRILLKLALTDDSQLGAELDKFVPLALSHLNTNDEKLRTKVRPSFIDLLL